MKRTVVLLKTRALWDRLGLLGRSQNWLARETGISRGYLSTLINEGARPLGTHPTADADGPGDR